MFFLVYFFKKREKILLIGIGEATHPRLDTKHVVRDGVHQELGIVTHLGCVVNLVEGQGHVIETGKVGGTGRLVSLRVEGERVGVDVLGRDPGEVLVRLDQTEVRGVAFGETVVAVELELAGLKSIARGNGAVVATFGVVRPHYISTPLERLGIWAADHPHESFHRVVEVKAEVGGTGGLGAGVLELLDEVLVGGLGETATLVGVEVDVVDKKAGVGDRESLGTSTEIEPALVAELDVDFDLVVLEGDEGQGQTRVAAEEELQGNVQLRGLQRSGGTGVAATDHFLEPGALLFGEGQLGPDVEPLTVMLVDALTANLELDVLNEGVTEGVDHFGVLTDGDLEPHVSDEIAVATDGASHAATEGGVTVEGLFDRLHGEVGVAAVDHLKEADFGLAGQEDVLGAVGYKLHKSSSHVCLLILLKQRKKIR